LHSFDFSDNFASFLIKIIAMKSTLPFILLALIAISNIYCGGKEDDDTPDPDQQDTKFTAQITGAETATIEFTLTDGVMDDYGISGSYSSIQDGLLQISTMELPTGFQLGFFGKKAGGFSTGTYPIAEVGGVLLGGYTSNNADATVPGYTATSSEIIITRAELVQDVINETYWADGNFQMTLQDQATPPNVINISGSFEHVAISAN
jgi:hypothetical protein